VPCRTSITCSSGRAVDHDLIHFIGAREPVSERNSLLTGNLTGNFTKIGPFGETLPVRYAAESVSCRTIPYKMKQGINSRRTGNLSSRAGNLLRLAGNRPPGEGPPSVVCSPPMTFSGELVGDSSTVEPRTLSPLILVRIQVPQLRKSSLRDGISRWGPCAAGAGSACPCRMRGAYNARSADGAQGNAVVNGWLRPVVWWSATILLIGFWFATIRAVLKLFK
jgi:hypothetical protein